MFNRTLGAVAAALVCLAAWFVTPASAASASNALVRAGVGIESVAVGAGVDKVGYRRRYGGYHRYRRYKRHRRYGGRHYRRRNYRRNRRHYRRYNYKHRWLHRRRKWRQDK